MQAVFLLNSLDLKWWGSSMRSYFNCNIFFWLVILSFSTAQDSYPVNSKVVAQIREEGFQRSEVSNTLSYMTCLLYTSDAADE